MIDWLAPSLTKNVPMIEVRMQTPPIASGQRHHRATAAACRAKKIAASTMVATAVTA